MRGIASVHHGIAIQTSDSEAMGSLVFTYTSLAAAVGLKVLRGPADDDDDSDVG